MYKKKREDVKYMRLSGLKWHFQLLIVNCIYELSAFTLLLVYLIKNITRKLKIAFFCADIKRSIVLLC